MDKEQIKKIIYIILGIILLFAIGYIFIYLLIFLFIVGVGYYVYTHFIKKDKPKNIVLDAEYKEK